MVVKVCGISASLALFAAACSSTPDNSSFDGGNNSGGAGAVASGGSPYMGDSGGSAGTSQMGGSASISQTGGSASASHVDGSTGLYDSVTVEALCEHQCNRVIKKCGPPTMSCANQCGGVLLYGDTCGQELYDLFSCALKSDSISCSGEVPAECQSEYDASFACTGS